ncbi:tail fiber protein [Breoghania sp.]|uniref:phage tail protein n=1 Tax=Breoghania sp. TaxID=2065378 RepID=UPI0032049100
MLLPCILKILFKCGGRTRLYGRAFLAEIKIIGFNFAPRGWAYCDGQILPVNQSQSLYSLLGTT